MRRWIAVLVSLALTACLLAGCGSKRAEQYGPYVQSLLDVSYKKDDTVYLELVDDTQENIDGYYNNTMTYWAHQVAGAFQMSLLTEELEARMVALMEDVFVNARYEVANAVEAGDHYTVEVTVYPILFTDLVYDEVAFYAEDFYARSAEGDFGDYENDEALQEERLIIYDTDVMDILESYLDKLEYGAPITQTVKVIVEKDGLYYIDEEDQYELESYLLQ